MNRFAILAAASLLGAPAFAESHASGDAAAGEKVFNRCQSCHVVRNDAGETLAGRNGRTGPNLYGVPGRQAGTGDFRYGDDIVAAGEQGLVWTQESFAKYVMDPTAYLREVTGDDSARGKMAFKLRKDEEALDVWAFITSLSPEPES